MPEIEIRPVSAGDIPALEALEHFYHTSHVWQMDRAVDEGQLSVTFREVRLPRSVKVEYPRPASWLQDGWKQVGGMLVANYTGQPVGYITLTEQLSAATAWIRDLVVSEKLRRKGIATALVLAAQDWATRRAYRRMMLEMQSKNIPAIRMSQHLGYDFCGYHDHYYPNQDIGLFFARYLR